MDPLTIALLGVGGTIFAAVVGSYTTHALGTRARNKRLASQPKYVLTVLIVALSRTGKTTFIKNFLNDPTADNSSRTSGIRRFQKSIPLPDEPEVMCSVEIVDYDGNDPGLIAKAVTDGTVSASPTVLGVLVDPTSEDVIHGEDQSRINDHLSAWDATSLKMLKGVVSDVSYVWLYINKEDLLDENERNAIFEKFEDLQSDLEDVFSGRSVEPKPFSGSLNVGAHTSEIFRRSVRHKTVAN